ncbi:TPA: methyl-accepting chemotaxis protein [Vibrio parahaemolyticus]|uniref:methyl-accepting chemotaxis protein n=3 Tax=unclassified Vibrio TaxID=2614977 RepID=UPI00187E751E|nr:methyl-accepting chemotaxis protein [Vibrio sp. OPT41]EJG1910500.1 methyl-accepting chemotaxis protein [Vibrio parahaemolyticus]MBE8583388.1 methyl-accepting chemotaxis protein [Vibrio sp. OPT41]HCH2836974.1 methyl-accepting chemotaxis protein [Vibrio parahaemolyticus]
MSSSWYRRGTVTVTDGSKEVVGVGTLWVDAGNKPLAGDIMFIAGSIYEVESITDNEHLSLFRPFTGVPPANGEYAIIRNTSVTIATRVAAMVAAAINSKQVLLDDLRGYYTSTADKVLIHTDDGSTIEVVPLQTLVSDITNLIAQSESIKNDLDNTQAALDLVRQYSNAAQGVEVEPGKYSAKSYAADAADTLALVSKAESDVDLKASQVQQTKTDIEQFVGTSKTDIQQFVTTSKTEIDAKATAISKAIDTQATTVKGEITALTSTSKQEITALATKSKKDITTLTTTIKSEISELVAGGTNSITSLTDTSKGAINTLVGASKNEITDLATTEKAAISQQSTTAISEMTSLKQSAEQAASTATQKATQAAASATSAAQSKTDAQTLKTQTEALANETKQVAEEIKSGSYVGWQIYCQSEANMKAQRALASNEFAASGFVHYGTGYTNNVNNFIINEGMWTTEAITDQANKVRMGRSVTDGGQTGTSKTPFPVTTIAGFISKLIGINELDKRVAIKFPEAPIGTVVYDSTGNCRGSGKATLDLTKDVDPKYGDVAGSVNEAVARAFEGWLKNADFRNGTSEWTYGNYAVLTPENGALRITNNGSINGQLSPKTPTDSPRTKVKATIVISDLQGGARPVVQYQPVAGTYKAIDLHEGVNEVELDFTAARSLLIQPKGSTTASMLVHLVDIRPLTEEVVINRVDMFGFEYFLEEISKANPFVYPYGCIQSKLTSIEGIATKESNRPITYYSVFDGDTTSKGKGVDFWAATDDQKRALVSNTDHNIYLLDDGRLVQWRVRQRTIAGIGNGKWRNINPVGIGVTTAENILNWDGGTRVKAQAGGDVVMTGSTGYFTSYQLKQYNDKPELGVFTARHASNCVDYECYFDVCGVVPRLNQGAYHPSFNPMGAAAWHKWGVAADLPWYDSRVVSGITSAGKCFTEVSATTQIAKTPGSGRISHGKNKRPDGKFYDAIYASGQGGVIDYRLPAWDVSSKEEASKIFQKVVNGTYRGEELAVRTWISPAIAQTPSPQATSIATEINTMDLYKVGGKVSLYDIATKQVLVTTTITGIRNGAIDVLDTFNRLAGDAHLVVTIESNIPVSGDFTQVDLFAEPSVILNEGSFKNGWLGGWAGMPSSAPAGDIDFTRKVKVGTPTRIYKLPSGAWSSGEMPNFNSILNGSTRGWSSDKTILYTFTYTAFAKQTKGSTNKPVLNSAGGLGAVAQSGGFHAITWGALLVESLIGKVPTSSVGGAGMSLSDWINIPIQHDGKIHVGDLKKVEPFDKPRPNNDSPAVKALWYQTANNQQCSLNFAWNELVYKPFTNPIVDTGAQMLRKRGVIYLVDVAGSALNGRLVIWNGNEASIPVDYTAYYVDANNMIKSKSSNAVSTIQLYTGDGWGDDSTIRIIDGAGTFINLNGDTCLYGTHELAIPYGYTKNKARAGSQVSGVDL